QRHAIHCAPGRKNKLAYIRVNHSVQHRQSAGHIVLKIFSGIDDRFADVCVGRKMHDGINPAQDGRKLCCITNISLNQIETLRERCVPGGELVVDYDFMASALESVRGVASDISRPSCYYDPTASSIPQIGLDSS